MLADLREAPEPARLAAVAEAVHTGSRVESVCALEGGIDNGMHVLELRLPSGASERVVLRRHGTGPLLPPAHRAANEWRLLRRLREAGVPCPRPLLDDSSGELTGTAALVLEYVSGAPVRDPAEVRNWHEQVARALCAVHAIDASGLDFLGEPLVRGLRVLARSGAPQAHRAHRLAEPLWSAIAERAEDLAPVPAHLIHADCWPGNLIWSDGALRAVIDWDQPALGDPAMDVAGLATDLQLCGWPDQADRFIQAYRRASGRALENLAFYELLALAKPLPDPAVWLGGDAQLAEAGLQAQQLRSNLERSIEAKLGAR
jgi:aminoglycoside phosphotransferase (APT) family kinase protein